MKQPGRSEIRVYGDIGTIVLIDDQQYRLVGFVQHINQLGKAVTLGVWTSRCPVCGITFQTTQPIGRIWFNRRCEAHKRPGIGVATKVSNDPEPDEQGQQLSFGQVWIWDADDRNYHQERVDQNEEVEGERVPPGDVQNLYWD